LPELPYACGLNTVALLTADLVTDPLLAVDGVIRLRDPVIEDSVMQSHQANSEIRQFWQARLVQTRELAGG
jgi:O-succinylbenzoate synthase